MDLNFAKIGSDVNIFSSAKIVNCHNISLGNAISIGDFVFIDGGIETVIKNFFQITNHSSINGGGKFYAEDFVTIACGVRILTGTDDYKGYGLPNNNIPSEYRKAKRSFVKMKKHVIVGANSVIMPGVTLGEGVAIGANSLVLHDCDSWYVYAGSPTKKINERNKEELLHLEINFLSECYNKDGIYIPKSCRR